MIITIIMIINNFTVKMIRKLLCSHDLHGQFHTFFQIGTVKASQIENTDSNVFFFNSLYFNVSIAPINHEMFQRYIFFNGTASQSEITMALVLKRHANTPHNKLFNPSSPDHFSRTYFPKGRGGVPLIINMEGHIILNLQYGRSYNSKFTFA